MSTNVIGRSLHIIHSELEARWPRRYFRGDVVQALGDAWNVGPIVRNLGEFHEHRRAFWTTSLLRAPLPPSRLWQEDLKQYLGDFDRVCIWLSRSLGNQVFFCLVLELLQRAGFPDERVDVVFAVRSPYGNPIVDFCDLPSFFSTDTIENHFIRRPIMRVGSGRATSSDARRDVVRPTARPVWPGPHPSNFARYSEQGWLAASHLASHGAILFDASTPPTANAATAHTLFDADPRRPAALRGVCRAKAHEAMTVAGDSRNFTSCVRGLHLRPPDRAY